MLRKDGGTPLSVADILRSERSAFDLAAEEATRDTAIENFPLDQLAVGHRAVIVSLKDEFAYLYLLRLGLVVGAEVELVRAVSRGSIRVFRVDSGELALRSDAASGISVRLLSPDEQRTSAE